jgi:threonine/homoserine/homoserine lactone efflux protein
MEIILLLKGILIGIVISAPVGPIGVLCIKRTFNRGRKSGLATGLGATTADGIYGGIAAYGVTYLSSFLASQEYWFRLAGGTILLFLGVKTFFSQSIRNVETPDAQSLASDYISTFFLTLTNPVTIIAFLSIFAALGLGVEAHKSTAPTTIVLGVIMGSFLWWFTLSSGINLLKKSLRMNSLSLINKISGSLLFIFALTLFISLV